MICGLYFVFDTLLNVRMRREEKKEICLGVVGTGCKATTPLWIFHTNPTTSIQFTFGFLVLMMDTYITPTSCFALCAEF